MSEDTDEQLDERGQEIREEQLLEALDRNGEVEQLHQLLQTEAMRDLIWRVLVKCHVYATSYSRNYGDMALAEGQRSIGLWLLSEIAEADPEAMLAMQTKSNRLAAAAAARERKKRTRRARPG